jgi:hypothetical protein
MSEPSLFRTEHTALRDLQQLVRDRATGEKAVVETYQTAIDAAEREVTKARKSTATARRKAEDELAAERDAAERDIRARFDRRKADREFQAKASKQKIEEQHRTAEATLKSEYKDKLWTIDSLLEAGEKEATDQKAELVRTAAKAEEHLAQSWAEAERHLSAVNLTREDVAFPVKQLPPATLTDPIGKLEACLENVDAATSRLAGSMWHKFTGAVGTMWCVFMAGGLAIAVALLSGLDVPRAIGVGVGGALVGGLLIRQGLYYLGKRQVRDRGSALGVYMAEADRARGDLAKFADSQFATRMSELKATNAENRKKTDDTFRPRIQGVVKQAVTLVAKLDMETAEALRTLADEREATEAQTASEFDARAAQLAAKFDDESAQIDKRYADKTHDAEATRDRTWNAMATAWHDGLDRVKAACAEVGTEIERLFPQWDAARTGAAPLAADVPTGIPFGTYAVDVYALPDGMPFDPRLNPADPLNTTVPALLPFPDKCSVLIKAKDEGRPATIAALQSVMLRFLTGLPPGKVRFTIIDPVGLGENFAAFMHLADSDEQLVSSRIWTEPGQIEKKLSDLTEHMENVIQKYLRNQYKSIEEYNRAAGEVAEPYRVLVIANFPTNFTPDAAKRLVSVMSSGPACGVCTLVGVDTAVSLPRDFRLTDLEQVAFNLVWKDGKFTPKDPAFGPYPLTMDTPPASPEVAQIVRRIGEASKTAARVEVPFEFIMPPADQVWKGSTKHGFEVPIGRAGATRRQVLSLGKGTAQHALVAGKTGSGKSTLLHALITNLSLMYSPDEAELYLIDFKKGVEFKLYASLQLPHARVIAVESEREFGLSVLQRLDGILRERGEEFRRTGVNDVAGYREAKPDVKLPRILFVVDEFQEFFVEDDKLAQEAALLLDRLVRQGRAFGVHVLLGSQTLGGAFSLARSTIDQMAVRIALQCSEADAQLILSKDNSAARLLTRPGEAIYNDANGLIEGNDPFQVVWLDEDRRESLLAPLRNRSTTAYPPPLVFEGAASTDLAQNQKLARLIDTPADQLANVGPPAIWLGDSVSIKDPTAAVFRAQSGANLLLIGQADEAALGVFSAGVVSLAARLRPANDGPRTLAVCDGTPDDSDFADTLRRVCGAVGLPSAVVERSQLAVVLAEFAAEVDRRIKGESADRSPRFLFVNGLQRFRELRKADDDFGFGRRGEKAASPGEQFLAILRDGPGVGVHTAVWCDSVANLTRAIDRGGLREFNLRALFQMNPNDSSQLIDTPAASRLGRNRALYIEDGLERPEKFRPYGLCHLDWLRAVGATLGLPAANGSAAAQPTDESKESDARVPAGTGS